MFSGARTLLRMSALRQALALTLAFLVLLGAGGALLGMYLSQQLRVEVDEELSREFDLLKQKIDSEGDLPDWFADDVGLLIFEGIGRGYPRADGRVVGPAKAEAFATYGFQSVPDFELFSQDAIAEALSAPIPASSEFEDEDGFYIDLLETLESGEEWRVFVGATTGGELAVFTPAVGGVATDLSSIIILTVILLSIPTLGMGVIYGLKAQRRLDHIAKGYERIADGDLNVRLAPERIRDDLDLMTLRIDGATERLQSSMRQMSEFSANIAHDLRTPLTRLQVQLDRAMQATGESEQLEKVAAQTEEIITIFDSIQRIARLRTGERKKEFRSVELATVCDHVRDIYEAVVEDSGRRLNIQTESPASIVGDKALMVQMLANLIENAIRHTPEGAEITLSAKGAELALSDTGPGIPESERQKVLEPLYRLDKSRNAAGSGLGLAMVKAIADLHGAELTLSETDTAQDQGLTVTIAFAAVS